jgi:acetylornithine aminotransferase
MALRISAKRVAATLKASNVTPSSNGILKRNASQAAAAASSLPEEIRSAIHVCSPAHELDINWHIHPQREAGLSNPDPASDSATTALVNEQAPYMVKTYVRPPPMFVKGEGVYLWDVENRRYLDFTAGIAVNALGHCDPEMSKLIAQQVREISLTPPPLPHH